MESEPQVLVRSLVFIGGGHAHVHALKMIGMNPIPGVQVTLITRDVDTPYSGMLPGHIAGHYTKEECHIDLRKMARFADVGLVHTEAVGLDTNKRLIHCKDGRPPIRYDVLSIDIGSTPKFVESRNPMELKRVTRVKPIDSFSARWDSIVERVLAGSQRQQQQQQPPAASRENGGTQLGQSSAALLTNGSSPAKVVVVGGGAGGVELALAMQYRLKELFREAGRDPDMVVVEIVNRGEVVLSSHNRRVQQTFKRVLSERKVGVHTGKEVVDVRDPPEGGESGGTGSLVCTDGTEIPFSEAIWCTNSGAAKWLLDTGLALNEHGFIEVNDFLESTNTPGVFAVGDCAHMVNHPRPKAGVFAVRQGPPLAENLRRMLEGRAMKGFKPQKAFLGLISTGDETAVLSWRGLAWESSRLWTFKDFIDRKWMKKYKELPLMDDVGKDSSSLRPTPPPRAVAAAGPAAVEAVQNASMRCGGCGSKVGAGVLGRVLSRLGVAGGLDDAAVVAPPSEPGAVTVHTVDFFRSFVSDPFVFGQIAANHALSDVHAMGADPSTALAIATIPFGGEAQVEGTLEQLLAGALKTLKEAGCSLVGGHTCEGADLALGLSVNGVARGGARSLLTKGGAAPGDALVLTKAVGTGAILAAEMRGRATSPWLQPAVRSMLQSNGPAATVLRDHGARACTDVTGFGVAGHLAEMLRGSPVQRRPSSSSCPPDGATKTAVPASPSRAVSEGGGGGVRTKEEGAASPNDAPPSSLPLNAELSLQLLPVLSGAVEAVGAGIVSSLQGQNERDNEGAVVAAAAAAAGGGDAVDPGVGKDPRFRLLFDPQTAGGLLASVPRDRAVACVSALRQAGYEAAAVIGSVTEARHEGEGRRIHVVSATTAPAAAPMDLTK